MYTNQSDQDLSLTGNLRSRRGDETELTLRSLAKSPDDESPPGAVPSLSDESSHLLEETSMLPFTDIRLWVAY